jgi:hypothetical protein
MNCKACGKPIDEHIEGYDLDRCMAKAVMGWKMYGLYHAHDKETGQSYELQKTHIAFVKRWNPSTNIDNAFSVIDILIEYGEFTIHVDIDPAYVIVRAIDHCAIWCHVIEFDDRKKLCLAICQAALMAVSE